ncbi:MAG: hypothetical protein J0653_06685, partial [Deltaproteobacteria bacterium]|nr:hypothetical protein [Deltaproteobacteria bacterium]
MIYENADCDEKRSLNCLDGVLLAETKLASDILVGCQVVDVSTRNQVVLSIFSSFADLVSLP